MQYEKVILEMLARIQTLEEQVRELQQAAKPTVETFVQETLTPPTARRTNTKVTEEMLEECYRMGRLVYEGDKRDISILAELVSQKTDMNPNNALMTIFAVVAMLNGELYKRTLSSKATAKFFENIQRDYGNGALQRAVASIRQHINYRRKLNYNADLLEYTCDQFQKQL
ncbi:MAG: hypothetical protein IJ995_04550 [Clostridia bacterium]|nr:hypothetical protein [Clostridia bacterium]